MEVRCKEENDDWAQQKPSNPEAAHCGSPPVSCGGKPDAATSVRRIKELHWDRRDSVTNARANEARQYDACRDPALRPVVDTIETDVLILGPRVQPGVAGL